MFAFNPETQNTTDLDQPLVLRDECQQPLPLCSMSAIECGSFTREGELAVENGGTDDRRSQDWLVIKLVRGGLAIEYGNTIDDEVRTLSQLVYDRKFPERGFVITTKEKKSQQEQ
jgi:hypothetical protein